MPRTRVAGPATQPRAGVEEAAPLWGLQKGTTPNCQQQQEVAPPSQESHRTGDQEPWEVQAPTFWSEPGREGWSPHSALSSGRLRRQGEPLDSTRLPHCRLCSFWLLLKPDSAPQGKGGWNPPQQKGRARSALGPNCQHTGLISHTQVACPIPHGEPGVGLSVWRERNREALVPSGSCLACRMPACSLCQEMPHKGMRPSLSSSASLLLFLCLSPHWLPLWLGSTLQGLREGLHRQPGCWPFLGSASHHLLWLLLKGPLEVSHRGTPRPGAGKTLPSLVHRQEPWFGRSLVNLR